jgi:hypothetical protein
MLPTRLSTQARDELEQHAVHLVAVDLVEDVVPVEREITPVRRQQLGDSPGPSSWSQVSVTGQEQHRQVERLRPDDRVEPVRFRATVVRPDTGVIPDPGRHYGRMVGLMSFGGH